MSDHDRDIITPVALTPHDPYAAFRFGAFNLYMIGNLLSIIGRQMLAVAVEWEIYARTHSATALGLVGLVLAVPVVALSLLAGHLADRYSRKSIIIVSQLCSAVASAALAVVSWKHLVIPAWSILRHGNDWLRAIAGIFERHQPAFHFDDMSVPLIYMLLFVAGTARTFGWAARPLCSQYLPFRFCMSDRLDSVGCARHQPLGRSRRLC